MKNFLLDTRKSLYPPIPLDIVGEDGEKVTYHSQKLTRAFLAAIEPLEEKIAAGETDIYYEWVSMMFGVKLELLEKLSLLEVQDVYLHASREIRNTEEGRVKREIGFMEDQLNAVKRAAAGLPPEKKKAKKVIPKNPNRPGGKK